MPLNPYKIVVDGYLVDFEGGVALLEKIDAKDTRHDAAAEKLCRLSRDLTFSLGHPAEYDPKYIARIAETFDRAATLIRETTKEVIAYRDHIQLRARVLREEMKATPAGR